jgi:secreted trypsin-like serine protease
MAWTQIPSINTSDSSLEHAVMVRMLRHNTCRSDCAAACRLLAPSGGGIPAAAFGAHLLCTDSSVSDACHGDSGGPLLRANTTVQVQPWLGIGIAG